MAAVLIDRTDRDPFEVIDWVMFTALALIWGASFMLIAVGIQTLHPGLVTWLRLISGAAAIILWPGHRPATREVAPGDLKRLIVLSAVWFIIPFTLFPIAEQHVDSAIAGVLNGASPIWAALLGRLFFHRPSRGLQRLGLLVGFLGVIVVSLSSTNNGGATAWYGVVMILLATLSYGVSVHLLGPITARYGGVQLTRYLLSITVVGTAPFGIWGLFHSTFSWLSVGAVVMLGVIGTAVASVLMALLNVRVGGPRSSFVSYLVPVAAIVFGMVFLGERIKLATSVGVVLVILGAFASSQREVDRSLVDTSDVRKDGTVHE